MNELSAPILVGIALSATLAVVAWMAWRSGQERRDVAFIASSAGIGGLCTVVAALA